MSGVLALLDDVAAIARLAATQVDDVALQATRSGSKVAGTVLDDAARAGTKAAGLVVDDTAVAPKYVQGLPAAREIPIVAKVARGSLFNKLVILLPVALLLSVFAPWLLMPLLMLGGCYLCFEGTEKVVHLFVPGQEHGSKPEALDAAHLERQRVSAATRTDFILSAEITTLSLAAIESDNLWVQGVVLAMVAVGITALVYGSVAILVKADDVGLKLAEVGRLRVTRAIGRGIVRGMPAVMTLLTTVGTAAMLWVGGAIVIHGLETFGWTGLGHAIHRAADIAAHAMPPARGAVAWLVRAALDGLFGLVLGLVIVPIVTRGLAPLAGLLRRAYG